MSETTETASRAPEAKSDRGAGGFFVLGAFLGAAVGALIGLLYAPRPGVETRMEWERKSDELRRKAEAAAEKAASRSEEFAEKARQYAARAEKAAGADAPEAVEAEPTVLPDDA